MNLALLYWLKVDMANVLAIGACSLVNFFASDRIVFRVSGRFTL